MANSGIEDIYIGESYKPTRKKGKGFIIFIFLLLILIIAVAVWYYFFSTPTVNQKQVFANSILSITTRKLQDKDFYNTLLKRTLEENSEMNTNITVSGVDKIEELQGIDINNLDFTLTSTNDLKNKNINSKLLINYSGNFFLEIENIVNDNKFALISNDIVNKYVGVKSENFKDIFESEIDLNFIYELINSDAINISDEDKKTYLEPYYQKIYNQIPEEKFSEKSNIVISKNDDYIDVKAYEMSLNQQELEDILVSVLTDLKNDDKLLDLIIMEDNVELNLDGNNLNLDINNEQELNSQTSEDTTFQLVPVSAVNFQTSEEINVEQTQEEEQIVEENQEDTTGIVAEHIQDPEGLVLENNEENPQNVEEKEFSTSDIIKILLGRKINISKEKIVEQIDEFIENFDGNGITITVYVSDEKTEKITIILPNENRLDIQFLEDTEKESTIEFTYLYKTSDFKDGISINIDEVHNSTTSSIRLVRNYIEQEKINKKEAISIKTEGSKNSSSITNDITITSSTNNNEMTISAENSIKYLDEENLTLNKLTEDNSVFLDDLTVEDRNLTIQAIKDKINTVLEYKKESLNLIDLNSKTSIITSNSESSTSNNRLLIKKVLEDKINDLKNQAIDNGEEFSLQNLESVVIDGFEVSTNIEEDRAVIIVNTETFVVDRDFNISDD